MAMSGSANLIAGCIKGDKASWEAFVKNYGKVVTNAVIKTFKSCYREDLFSDVVDVSQDVFKKLLERDYKALKDLRKEESIEPWLCVIAHNKALDYIRKKGIQVSMPLFEIREPETEYHPQEELAMAKEVQDLLRDVLKGVKPQERLIFTLFYVEGRGYKEISEIMDLPVNTVATKLFRTRNKMRERIKGMPSYLGIS